jgi:hypothetical protein
MARNLNLIAIIPVLVALAALVLSFLCVFAGNSPGFMEPYSIFTLNTTRLGQNAVEKIDNKIMGFNITKVITKRSLRPVRVVDSLPPTITEAPILIIDRRQLGDLVDDLSEGVAGLKSDAGDAVDSVKGAVSSKVTEVSGAVESGVNSIENLVVSKISSAVASVQSAMVETVDDTYNDWIDDLDLKGFYSIYLRSTCEGEYVTPDGKNITVGDSAFPPNGTSMDTDSCSKHSSLNPLGLIRILFYIGIFFAGLSLLLGIWGMICFSRKLAILNAVGSLPALGFLGLATVATHGLAVAVSKLLNLLTRDVGLETEFGGKWIAMAWAMTILVLVNIGLWTVLALFGERFSKNGKSGRKSGKALPEHEMKTVHSRNSPSSEERRYDDGRF